MTDSHGHDHGASDVEHRTRALESLLIEKGFLTADAIDTYVEQNERHMGPLLGARVVAHAWVDRSFKNRLLEDATAALVEIGIDTGTRLVVVENTPEVHNVVCCTLCSCYPWKLLGLPPRWYKSPPYRSRIVIEPRSVLDEFGLHIPDSVKVCVWDSTSECRYMVLPERPSGAAHLSEENLTALVSRDAMVGVARVEAPAGV